MEIWIRCGTDIFDYVQVYENSQSHIHNERGLCWFSDSNRIDIAHPNGMRLLLLNFLEHLSTVLTSLVLPHKSFISEFPIESSG